MSWQKVLKWYKKVGISIGYHIRKTYMCSFSHNVNLPYNLQQHKRHQDGLCVGMAADINAIIEGKHLRAEVV